jgi:hypothetical protein
MNVDSGHAVVVIVSVLIHRGHFRITGAPRLSHFAIEGKLPLDNGAWRRAGISAERSSCNNSRIDRCPRCRERWVNGRNVVLELMV